MPEHVQPIQDHAPLFVVGCVLEKGLGPPVGVFVPTCPETGVEHEELRGLNRLLMFATGLQDRRCRSRGTIGARLLASKFLEALLGNVAHVEFAEPLRPLALPVVELLHDFPVGADLLDQRRELILGARRIRGRRASAGSDRQQQDHRHTGDTVRMAHGGLPPLERGYRQHNPSLARAIPCCARPLPR